VAYAYDIFVSYSRRFPYADWTRETFFPLFEAYLAQVLRRAPKIFLDKRDISPGATWPLEIRNALARSRFLVAVLTPLYFNSDWCLAEFITIRNREFKTRLRTPTAPSGLIFPIKVFDGDAFSQCVKKIQMLDCTAFAYHGPAFMRTEAYISFQQMLIEWRVRVGNAIRNAPEWRSEWLNDAYLNCATKYLSRVRSWLKQQDVRVSGRPTASRRVFQPPSLS
jgi:hypothetical protein